MEQYTDYYFETKVEFEKAEKAFDAKPNRKTATILSDLRRKFERMPESKKYTSEHLKERQQRRQSADRQMLNDLRHLLNIVTIETASTNGQIDDSTRLFLHETNDITNPYKA